MPTPPTLETPVYHPSSDKAMSLKDLLDRFSNMEGIRASDLHLKVGQPPVYRVNGQLIAMSETPLTIQTVAAFKEALLTPSELDTLAREGSLDSSLALGKMQFRINIFSDYEGPALAIRALDASPPPPEQLGFPTNAWQDIVERQAGLVLITGATGAGKSTTVASLIDRIAASRAVRIITLEDPIEYRLTSKLGLISQRQVGRHVASFERGLRDALREDPDVIFVGEMRDSESARWTLTAAETGHLVFSTLHTRDVRGSITRILDMFPAKVQDEVAQQLSLSLAYVICQTLVPRADGQGRIAAMEILNSNQAIQNQIRTGKYEQLYSVMQTRTNDHHAERMITMEECLVRLVIEGKVDLNEAAKASNHLVEFESTYRHAL